MTPDQIISVCVFIGVMALIVSNKVHQTLAALIGAVVVMVLGVMPLDASVASIDFNALGLLIGMMMFVTVVKSCGIFEFIAVKAAQLAKGSPWLIMVYFVLISAILSSLLDNVTTVLLIGPMTLMVCKILDVDPVPYFLTEIVASNVGGTATLIGDPPNVIIGSQAGLSFFDFLNYNGPAIALVLAAIIIFYRFKYGRNMRVSESARAKIMALDASAVVKDAKLLKISVVMVVLTVIGFIGANALGLESSVIALVAATIIIILGKFNIEEALEGVEWGTIAFLVGLFVVVGALNDTGVISIVAQALLDLVQGNTALAMIAILWISALFSALLNNIPFVATAIPIVLAIQATGMDVFPLWWAMSLGVCLGGNGTLIGASANVVLCAISDKEGYPISFGKFFKECFPVMILTVVVSMVYLLIRF